MTVKYEIHQRAEGRIRVTISRMAEKYPFHTKILERFKIVERRDVETMAVAAAAENVLLFHNPEFVVSLPADELAGVLLHEVHHVLFGHIFVNPKDYPDDWARIVSEEITVNEFVKKEPLPKWVITLDLFPELPPMESTDQRYKRLKKRKNRIAIGGPSIVLDTARDSDAQSTGKSDTQGSGRRRRQKQKKGTLDNHDVWQEFAAEKERAQNVVEGIVQDAAIEVGADQVPKELRDLVGQLTVGDTPGSMREQIAGDRAGTLNWRRLLRRYVGHLFTVRPVFNRPPRRFPELAGIVPGKRRQSERPRVLSIIDTSGSISHELLEQISAELARLARHYEVTVVECDCEIQAVYRFRPIENVRGRGGTDLRPPFRRQFLRKHRPDLIVYFTDGFGDAPTKKPRLPTIWCLVPGGEAPADWGRVIQMES